MLPPRVDAKPIFSSLSLSLSRYVHMCVGGFVPSPSRNFIETRFGKLLRANAASGPARVQERIGRELGRANSAS